MLFRSAADGHCETTTTAASKGSLGGRRPRGHASLQTTQIYAELSQNTVDKHLKEWNEKWFSPDSEAMKESRKQNEMPDFLNI